MLTVPFAPSSVRPAPLSSFAMGGSFAGPTTKEMFAGSHRLPGSHSEYGMVAVPL